VKVWTVPLVKSDVDHGWFEVKVESLDEATPILRYCFDRGMRVQFDPEDSYDSGPRTLTVWWPDIEDGLPLVSALLTLLALANPSTFAEDLAGIRREADEQVSRYYA
jgi:hypothetical protein